MNTLAIHARTVFPGPCNAAHYNVSYTNTAGEMTGYDLCWQSESPRSISIRGQGAASRGGSKRARDGVNLAKHFGGTWRWVPGFGCPGGWSGDDLTPAEIVRLAEYLELTIVCYLYGDHDLDVIPAEFNGSPAYRNTDGYYSTPAN